MTSSLAARSIAAGMVQAPLATPAGVRMLDASPDDWVRVFDEFAAIGFDAIEIHDNWLRFADLSVERRRDLLHSARSSGLAVPAVTVARSSIIDPVDGAANLAYSHRAIDAAAELGAGVICLGLHRPLLPAQRSALWFWAEQGSVDPDDDEVWAAAVRGFRDLGIHAAGVGVAVSLELYEDTYLGTSASAVRLIEEIGLDTVGLNPDLGNLIRLHRPVERWDDLLRATLPYANYWHVKNYLRDEDPASGQITTSPSSLESGIINYRDATRLAAESGYPGIFTCEHYGGDSLGVSARNRDYLRSLLIAADRSTAAAPIGLTERS
ncbi:MAG: sugar phosphate isomerase/epimerase family protein [Pseudolysinimonas sp.]|uniref:sugar phosphate isomerase/epimerase family protein n=1 Tax=Pseudolysinimonas sp. TaxID=2680009 RepID=UPI003C775F71